jgi:hypothetical protein
MALSVCLTFDAGLDACCLLWEQQMEIDEPDG